ncbi:MAG: DUF1109 domain-containing protein [Hyphomicrobiaceae bacterium]|nr:MAG: DUF1109 domain-containing protein [Hyphomicrobiaceae bacterium]
MDTDELIRRLAADLQPVRPLKPPWVRALLWLGIALPYVAAVVWGKLTMIDASQVAGDVRFLVEQAATLATALTAAIAAFCSVIPGFGRRVLFLPLAPLGVWLASVGQGCVQDWLRLGAEGLRIRPDWDCLPLATVIGIVPTIVLVIMLRKGAPLRPRVTLALAALAVASVANFGMQFAHVGDASIMVLAWHLGAVAVLSMLGGWLGELILGWGHALGVR